MCCAVLRGRSPGRPYTVNLLIFGLLLGLVDHESGTALGSLHASLSNWRALDPHTILYMFLPPLIFESAMSPVNHFAEHSFQIERTALHSYGPGPHSC